MSANDTEFKYDFFDGNCGYKITGNKLYRYDWNGIATYIDTIPYSFYYQGDDLLSYDSDMGNIARCGEAVKKVTDNYIYFTITDGVNQSCNIWTYTFALNKSTNKVTYVGVF